MEEQETTDRYTLADLERWNEISREVDPPIRTGVFGDPVTHSLSPEIAERGGVTNKSNFFGGIALLH